MLEGAFRLLRLLPEVQGPGQVRRLADLTGIPYSSVHRILQQSVDIGLVTRSGGSFSLGAGVLELAGAVEPVPGLRRRAATVMQSLREHTGATLSLVTWMGDHAIVLDLVPGGEGLPFPVASGHRLPPAAAGTVALAGRAGARGIVVNDGDDLPGLTCYAKTVPAPGGARVALQLSASAEHPAARFAAVVDQGAARISAGLRNG